MIKTKHKKDETQPLLKPEALPLYIKKYVIGSEQYSRNKAVKIAKIIAGIVGALWGIPWINSSKSAAIIFPQGPTRDAFGLIFATGIVVTIGTDGSWIMSACADELASTPQEERILIEGNRQHCCLTKTSKILPPAICSFLSCIAPVYSAFKYNEGWEKYLSLIILVINYGYGFFGYSKFIVTISQKIREQFTSSELMAIKNELVEKTQYLSSCTNASLEDITDDGQLIETIRAVDLLIKPVTFWSKSKNALQGSAAIIIPMGSSVVSILLTKEFLQSTIYDNAIFGYGAAIFSEVPGYTVGVLATYTIFGKLLDFLTCNNSQACNKYALLTNAILPGAILLLSLTAPTAASYIAYTTVESEISGTFWPTIAAVLIGLHRLIFSNFTLNSIANSVINFFCKKESRSENRLHTFNKVLSKTRPEHFQYLADSQQSSGAFFSEKNHFVPNLQDDSKALSITVANKV